MILVLGGTGRLGTLLVDRLTGRGMPVRVLTRMPAAATTGTPALVTHVTGDVRDAESLARAMEGAAVVVSAMHGFPGTRDQNPTTIDRDGNVNVADAARRAGADLVLMSVVGASATHPMELFRMKYAAEEHARQVGLPLTVVRASAFVELWIEILEQTAGRRGRPLVFGSGNNPINVVSVRDVAAVVDRAVSDHDARGRTFDVTGPQNITMNELAEVVQSARHRQGRPRHVPRAALAAAAATIGRLRPELGRQLEAALAMDRLDLSAGPSHLPDSYPVPSVTPEQAPLPALTTGPV